jgi:hypothetical protein
MNCRFCQAELPPHAPFCSNCGQPTGIGAPGGAYGAAPAPGGYGPPQQQNAYGSPAGPAAYGSPHGYSPLPPSPPAGDGGGGMKLLGGCGLAGCLGVALAGMFAFGLIALFAISGSGSGGSSSSSASGGRDLPNSGSLRELVTETVGGYRLIGAGEITSPSEALQGGVVDSQGAVYSIPDGGQLKVFLFVYASEADAKSKIDRLYDRVLGALSSGEKLERGTVIGRGNEVIGSIVVYTNANLQSVTWSNHKLVAQVVGRTPHPFAFQKATKY